MQLAESIFCQIEQQALDARAEAARVRRVPASEPWPRVAATSSSSAQLAAAHEIAFPVTSMSAQMAKQLAPRPSRDVPELFQAPTDSRGSSTSASLSAMSPGKVLSRGPSIASNLSHAALPSPSSSAAAADAEILSTDAVVNEVVCGAMMLAYERAGMWAEAVGVLGRARAMGLKPNTVMYNTAISAAAKVRATSLNERSDEVPFVDIRTHTLYLILSHHPSHLLMVPKPSMSHRLGR